MKARSLKHAALFATLVLSLVITAEATTVQLPASKDTTLYQSNPNNGAGGAPGFLAGTNSQLSIRRALVAFDTSSIPSNATITDVQLRLVIGQIAGAGGSGGGLSAPIIDLHKLLVNWGEANTGASTATNLNGIGQGSAALAGDATWNDRFFGASQPWSSPGGQSGADYTAGASASLAQSNNVNDVSLWFSTPALVADVQGWLAAPATNFGWMLINQDESAAQTFRGFYSRNFNPNPPPANLQSLFPKLIVTYLVPEPTSLGMMALGLAVLGAIARKRKRVVA
ncbi:MAG TPA: DNRLRE domain-containing protein [Pirellulales bacterium]|jgi:hypothetical protein|nr:DNRLRE domain-containing protein [Pirellulales bacterium]